MTRINEYIAQSPEFDKNMSLPLMHGAFDLFVSQNNSPNTFITQEMIDGARLSAGREFKIPALDWNGDVEVKNVRSCVIPKSHNNSRLVKVTFADFVVDFTLIPALHQNNYISLQRDFTRKMRDRMTALAKALDITALATLSANKSLVFNDLIGHELTPDNAVVTRNWSNGSNMLGSISPIMWANNYNKGIHIVGNAGIKAQTLILMQLGQNQAINKALELNGLTFHYTGNLENEDDVVSGLPFYGSGFAVEDGNIGFLTVQGREHLRNMNVGEKAKLTFLSPELRIPLDYYTYRDVQDVSSEVGEPDMICNEVEFHSFAVSAAFVTAFNSHPEQVPNPIFKFALTQPLAGIPTVQMPL